MSAYDREYARKSDAFQLVVLSPFGRLSHYVLAGDARTICGRPCEDWQLVRDTHGAGPPAASCLRCSGRHRRRASR